MRGGIVLNMPINDAARLFDSLFPVVQEALTSTRFAHVERVVETAAAIAKANDFTAEELGQLRLAALLHDIAREYSREELLARIPARNDIEAEHPLTLHGPVGALVARELGVHDETVLRAIEQHAFGAPLTDRVSIALYVADKTEPGRGILTDARELALAGKLEAAFCVAIASAIQYLKEQGKHIHPRTYEAFKAAC